MPIFQTKQESLVDDIFFPFPIDDGVSRCLAATTRQQSRDNHIDQPYHPDIDGQTHTHEYNTRAKVKADNVAQGGGQKKMSIRGSEKKAERNGGGLSCAPAELHKKQCDDLDIGPEVCSASVATRHYWNYWDMLQIENGILMRHFVIGIILVIICIFWSHKQCIKRFCNMSIIP